MISPVSRVASVISAAALGVNVDIDDRAVTRVESTLAIKFASEFVGPDRLLYSSDHPWVEPSLIVDCVRQAKLSAADEKKLFTTNAQKLFRL